MISVLIDLCNKMIHGKNHLIYKVVMGIIPAVLLTGIFAMHIYCFVQTGKEYTFTFSQEHPEESQNGLSISCTVQSDKVWKNLDETRKYDMGAQYDITLVNNSKHAFKGWSGIIYYNPEADIEIDGTWNIEYTMENNVMTYKVVIETQDFVSAGNSQRFGYVMNSDELVYPETFVVKGQFIYRFVEIPGYFVSIALLVLWGMFVFTFMILRAWNFRLLERQVHDVQVLWALVSMYSTVLMLDMETHEIEIYKLTEKFKKMFNKDINFEKYDKEVKNYVENIVAEEDREQLYELYDLNNLLEMLKQKNNRTYHYRIEYNNEIGYFETMFLLLEDQKHCAILFRNVDEQQRREMLYKEGLREAVLAAEKANRAKTEFLSHMAHEFRTPMNAIIGMSEIISQGELDDKQREYIDVIERSGKALVSLVNNVLDMSKIEAGKMELAETVYSPRMLLKDLNLLLSTRVMEKSLTISVEVDEEMPEWLYGDELKLRQVIINLANNAIKYTKEGTVKIKIMVLNKTDEKVRIKVSVEDTGIGIKEEDIEHLFEAFAQMDVENNYNIEGTGLGLAIAKQMVDLLGGRIDVSSEYGKGSIFSFAIEQKISGDEKKQIGRYEFTAPKAKVLVIDDKEINLLVAESLLETYKVRTRTVTSGIKALKMLENGARFDIIFIDNVMPDMDGIETVKRIKKLENGAEKIPVVALTGDLSESVFSKFKDAGVVAFMSKPLSPGELNRILYTNLPKELIV